MTISDWPAVVFTAISVAVYLLVLRWALSEQQHRHRWHHVVVLILATVFWWLGEAQAIRIGKYQYNPHFLMFPLSGVVGQPDALYKALSWYMGLISGAIGGPNPVPFGVANCPPPGQTSWAIPVPVVLLEASLVFTMLRLSQRHFITPENATRWQRWLLIPVATGGFCALLMLNTTAILDPVVSTKDWCSLTTSDPAALNGLRGLNLGLWHWFTNEKNPAYWFGVPFGNYAAWFVATFIFTAFNRLDGPGKKGVIRPWKYWFLYVPGLVIALFLLTLVTIPLYFGVGIFIVKGKDFLHLSVDDQTWQFIAIGLIVALGFLCVALGRKLYTPNFMWVLWLPQFSMLVFCLLAFVVKLDFPLLFLVWSAATGVAVAVAWWARGLANPNPALGPGVART